MKNRHERMKSFEQQAEKLYGYGGDRHELIGATNFYAGQTRMMAGEGLESIDDSDRTLTFIITNAHATDTKKAVLFGANKPLVVDADLTIEVVESSHEEVREDSKANPFVISGFKMEVSAVAQFAKNWTKKVSSVGGTTTSSTVPLLKYRSSMQQIPTLIDAPTYVLAVDGRTSLEIDILPASSTTIIFNVASRNNQVQILKGQPTLAVADSKPVTGNPIIDITQGRF